MVSTHRGFELVLPELQKHFTAYAMVRRGRGESDDAGADYSLEREVEDVVALIDSTDGPVSLLGHSHGAILALEAALRRTDRVRRLVLYEGHIPLPEGIQLFPAEAVADIRSRLDAGDEEGALITFYRDVVSLTPEEIEMIRSLPQYPALVAMAPTIPREAQAEDGWFSDFDPTRVSGFGTPTLILVGGDSPAFEKAAAEALQAALPDGRVVVLPGQGHVAHRTAPELFAREVMQFLVHG
jgi:pimeloyl-ACP methyl ester carboxylesterase